MFDDPHFAEPLAEATAMLEEIASDVYGAPTTVLIETANAQPTGRRAEDKPKPTSDDPVLKAFQKHLGGEVVEPRKR